MDRGPSKGPIVPAVAMAVPLAKGCWDQYFGYFGGPGTWRPRAALAYLASVLTNHAGQLYFRNLHLAYKYLNGPKHAFW